VVNDHQVWAVSFEPSEETIELFGRVIWTTEWEPV
jgi:hypothetical protein